MKKLVLLVTLLLAMTASMLLFSSCKNGGISGSDIVGIIDGITDGVNGNITAPTNLRYDGKYVSWDKVSGATSYLVSANGGTELEYNTSSYRYNNKTGEDFTISVKAKNDKKTTDATVVTFSLLDSVKNIDVADDGTISWDEVTGADSYTVEVDGTSFPTVMNSYSDLTAGTHKVSVKPNRTAEPGMVFYSPSDTSTSKTITICENVLADKITYVDGVLAWQAVKNAAAYEILINNQLEDPEVIGNKYDFDAHNGSFTVSIRALGNHTSSFDSKEAAEKNFIFLEAPTDIHVEDGILIWEPVDGAQSYTMRVNGSILRQTFTECKYTGLRAGEEAAISIRANANDNAYYAGWSDVKNFLLLESPTLIWNDSKLDGEVGEAIGWNAVNSATGYVVSMTFPGDKEPVIYELDETARAFGHAYLDAGTYTVAVKAKAPLGSTTVCDSAYSPEIKIIRLDAPKASSTNFVKSYPDDVSLGFDVTFNAVANASGYELYRDNTKVAEVNSSRTQFARVTDFLNESVMDEQIYQYRIRTIGSGYVNKTRMAVLSSLTDEDMTLNFSITVLAMPSDPTVAGYELSFGAVNKTSNYTVAYGSNRHTTGKNSYDLSVIAPGTYDIRVNARGNEATVLSSNFTAPLTVNRLSAPQNIRFTTIGAGGMIRFDEVSDAESYDVVVNGKTINIDANSDENFSKEISNDTQLHVRSVANYFGNTGVYYMTSPDSDTKFFTKLPIPTFGTVKFSGDQLVWNAITNFTGFSPSYRVYDEGDVVYENLKGASMSMAEFEGGKRYTFKIQAIGDGTRYINSEISDTVDVYKLPAPTLEIDTERNEYKWITVAAASSYSVSVDGKISSLNKQDYEADYCYYDPKVMLTTVGTHTIEIYAVGDGINNMDSSKFVLSQEVKQLELPEFSCTYSEDHVQAGGKIVVEVTKTSPYATAYSFVVGGATVTKEELIYESKAETAGTYKVKIYAVGGVFVETGAYYINSRETGEKSVVLLASPGDITIDKLGHMTWNSVSANYYDIVLEVNGTDTYTTTTNTTSLEVKNFLLGKGISYSTVKTLKVTITACGASALMITSAESVKEFSLNG